MPEKSKRLSQMKFKCSKAGWKSLPSRRMMSLNGQKRRLS
uniref:Uncharacterized protein n=1 Tax=Rhizophora mucronata TaxID=61149 RepID=A0A2P2J1A4_RHIMU